MGHQLVRLLRCRVQAERVVHVVVDGKGHPGIGPVDRTGGGEDEMLHLLAAAPLEDIQESDEVALHVGVGVFERVADARLGGEVDDDLGPLAFKKRLHGRLIGEVGPDEAEVSAVLQKGEARLLQGHVVVGVQIVEADHSLSSGEKAPGEMEADETRRAGYENPPHCFHLVDSVHLRCIARRHAVGCCDASAPGRRKCLQRFEDLPAGLERPVDVVEPCGRRRRNRLRTGPGRDRSPRRASPGRNGRSVPYRSGKPSRSRSPHRR